MRQVLAKAMVASSFLLLCACASSPAPVEDRSARASDGYRLSEQGLYRVQRGDTLYSIAFRFGLDWKDMAGWNGIGRPYTIYPGQELRVTAAPGRHTAQANTTTRPAARVPSATTRSTTRSTTRPAQTSPPSSSQADTASSAAAAPPQTPPPPASAASGPPDSASTTASSSVSAAASPPLAGPLRDPDRWLWPTEGQVITRFSPGDPARKGIDIAGRAGQDVIASAAGDVVYSGNGLIGFGELIIIKHSDSMLTAYAHNRRRLVQEGKRVAAGSRIAEMGQNDQEKTMLHFELRIDGKPVDPLKYLPPR